MAWAAAIGERVGTWADGSYHPEPWQRAEANAAQSPLRFDGEAGNYRVYVHAPGEYCHLIGTVERDVWGRWWAGAVDPCDAGCFATRRDAAAKLKRRWLDRNYGPHRA